MKIVGHIEEEEDSCPIRGEADVESCCLDIKRVRGEHSLEIQISRKPGFIISAACTARHLISLSLQKHLTALFYSHCVIVFEPFIYLFIYCIALSVVIYLGFVDAAYCIEDF